MVKWLKKGQDDLHKHFGIENKNEEIKVRVIAISKDTNENPVGKVIDKLAKFKTMFVGEHYHIDANNFDELNYKVLGVPTSMFIDKQGQIAFMGNPCLR